jgi:RNA polymerase sigma factor (sigma-70 family)
LFMISRHSITELFSTFAQFTNDRFVNWVTDGALKRSMLHAQQQVNLQTASETFWVLYWYKFWQQQPQGLTVGHLAAYLQETCYWVAQQRSTRTASKVGLADCFQIAIAALPTALKGYNLEQGASLKAYASLVFSNAIRDSLRQQREADTRTDWGLLRKVSQKQLVESLQAAGFSADTVTSYRLAWLGFKTFCTPSQAPTTRQLPRPTPTTWAAIAHFYNTQRQQLSSPPPAATPEQLERWLLTCAKQIRAYLNPTLTSLNAPRVGAEAGEIQDDLPDREEASPLAVLMTQEAIQERQAQRLQVNQVLTTALQNLDPDVQLLLELYCRQELTQQEIAAKLGIKQYTVSRRLSSAREQLLLAMTKWSQETLHISLTSTAVKGMSAVLEEWLQEKFSGSSMEVPK